MLKAKTTPRRLSKRQPLAITMADREFRYPAPERSRAAFGSTSDENALRVVTGVCGIPIITALYSTRRW
jgi:hypothetical protein